MWSDPNDTEEENDKDNNRDYNKDKGFVISP